MKPCPSAEPSICTSPLTWAPCHRRGDRGAQRAGRRIGGSWLTRRGRDRRGIRFQRGRRRCLHGHSRRDRSSWCRHEYLGRRRRHRGRLHLDVHHVRAPRSGSPGCSRRSKRLGAVRSPSRHAARRSRRCPSRPAGRRGRERRYPLDRRDSALRAHPTRSDRGPRHTLAAIPAARAGVPDRQPAPRYRLSRRPRGLFSASSGWN